MSLFTILQEAMIMFKKLWTVICELFSEIFEQYIELDICEKEDK
jgi:hypothetical protein